MAEKAKENAKEKNNMMMFAAIGAVVVALAIGGYFIQQKQSKKTMSMEIGGKRISATISQ